MSRIILGLAAVVLAGGAALPNTAAAPSAIANHANGLSYQPSPGTVATRERAAGVPSSAPSDKQLESIDRTLLSKEGASTKSVPDVAAHP